MPFDQLLRLAGRILRSSQLSPSRWVAEEWGEPDNNGYLTLTRWFVLGIRTTHMRVLLTRMDSFFKRLREKAQPSRDYGRQLCIR